jgi:hypothetical protein
MIIFLSRPMLLCSRGIRQSISHATTDLFDEGRIRFKVSFEQSCCVCSWQVVGGFSSGDDNVDPFDSW